MVKYGFIGAGNMGFAMMKGVAKSFGKEAIVYTDVSKERLEYVKNEINVPYVEDNKKCMDEADYIILAVKPQYMDSVLQEIDPQKYASKIFISIAPGLKIEQLKAKTDKNLRIVRAMPNTPAMVLEGMSAICFSQDNYTEEEKKAVIDFFNSFGETVELTEKQMDMVVPIASSSPAYIYMFIEAMADGGVLCGLPRDLSYKLAAKTVLGSAKMVLETGEHPGKLKDAVCSPGGTTIEAVRKLEELGLRSAVIEAMKACYDKTVSFGK